MSYVTKITFAFYSEDKPTDEQVAELSEACIGGYESMCDGTYDIGFVETVEFGTAETYAVPNASSNQEA